MSLISLLLFLIFLLTPHPLSAQGVNVSISLKDASLQQLLTEIESKSDIRFSYIDNDLDTRKDITITTNEAVESILDRILPGKGMKYTKTGNTIAVQKVSASQPVQKSITITGTVSENDMPMPGVNVLLKGTLTGVVTDVNGKYSINVPGRASVLVFSFVGFVPQEVIVNDRTVIDIRLEEATKAIDEVVIVGYGVQRKRDVTTSIASLRAEDIEDLPVNNVMEAMAGKLPGVQISQGVGKPGAPLSVKVRGVGTITAGSSPLYVVDGVPLALSEGDSPLNTINMNDIESIEVLKDASSAAIYGSRGSNGVVIITTKKGKDGKAVVSFNANWGWQSLSHKIKMLDAYQYADLVYDARNNSYSDAMLAINQGRANAGQAPLAYSFADNNAARLVNSNRNTNTIIPDEIVPYLERTPGLTNTDWQDEIYRVAPIQNYSLSVGGGTPKIRYFTSMEYLNQQGIIINSDFERYNARLNLDFTEGKFQTGVTFTPSMIKEHRVTSEGTYSGRGIVSSALHYAPIWPVYNDDGTYNFDQNSWSGNTNTLLPNGTTVNGNSQTQAWNPVALAMLDKDEVTISRVLGNIYAQYSLTDNLNYKVAFGMDMYHLREDIFRPSTIPQSNTAGNPESEAEGTSSTKSYLNWQVEQTLNYKYLRDNHHLTGVAGWIVQKETRESNYMYANGFISNNITTLNAGTVTRGNSQAEEWTLVSGLVRLQYDYASKYLLSAAFRADGSSKFGKENKWGIFPSVSAGWRLSSEEFMRNLTFIDDLKVRVSYGLTGNFQIPAYGAQGSMKYIGYVMGSTPSVIKGAAPDSQPNPNLHWEKTSQLNFGFDGLFFNNILSLALDVYNSNTYDLLLNVPVPLSTGYDTQLQNIGKVRNRGIEFTAGLNLRLGEVTWQSNFNISANRNKVMALGPGDADMITSGSVSNAYFITRIGEPIGSYYLPVVDGVFLNQSEVDSNPHYLDSPNNNDLSTSKPGDFRFRDVNGDGVIDLGDTDRDIVGNYMPDFIYGFTTSLNWKGIDVAVALQGVQGSEILNLSRRYFYNHEGNMNNYAGALNRWRSESDPGSGKNVRANRVGKAGNGNTSSWHVEDGSYLRIRNITLGYTLPKAWVNRLLISNARVYLSVQNPFTFTDYEGYNPEVSNRDKATTSGEDYGVYPLAKTISVGLNMTF